MVLSLLYPKIDLLFICNQYNFLRQEHNNIKRMLNIKRIALYSQIHRQITFKALMNISQGLNIAFYNIFGYNVFAAITQSDY